MFLNRILKLTLISFLFSCASSEEVAEPESKISLTTKEVKILQGIEDQLEITIYFTGDMPEELKEIENEIRNLLETFHQENPKIKFSFFDPYSINDKEEREAFMRALAVDKRVSYAEVLKNSNPKEYGFVFTGGVVKYQGVEMPVSFFDENNLNNRNDLKKLSKKAIESLKPRLFRSIRSMTSVSSHKLVKIAFLSGHGEADENETFIIQNEISKYYWNERVNIKDESGKYNLHALDDLTALIICKPTEPFAEQEKFIIDQFIMNGGKVLWLVDPIYVIEDSLLASGQTFGIKNNIGIEEMLLHYGVKLNNDLIVSKQAAPIEIKLPTPMIFPWYFYPLVGISKECNFSTELNNIKLEYAGTLDFVGDTNKTRCIKVIETNKNSFTINAPVRINYRMVEDEKIFNSKTNEVKMVACLLVGEFNSYCDDLFQKYNFPSYDSQLTKVSPKSKMLIIADGDVIINKFISRLDPETKQDKFGYLKLDKDVYNVTKTDGTPKYEYNNLEFFMRILDEMIYD